MADRIEAVDLLSHQPLQTALPTFDRLLDVGQPAAIHIAAIETAGRRGDPQVAQLFLSHWSGLGPSARRAALNLLLRRPATTKQVLHAMAQGTVNPAIVDIDRRVLLLRHRDAEIKKLAEQLFGGAVSANRRQVAEKYAEALSREGSIDRGRKVFDRVCGKCHRIDGRGFEVGPDISDVRNRSREALLFDILDPNKKLEPQYTEYLVATADGRVFSGLVVAETAEAVVIRQAEGKEEVISRDDIEEMRSSGKSLMPEGIEKEVSVEEMADVLEYLKGRR